MSVCMWYNYHGIDPISGVTKCNKRLKPLLVYHKLFDSSKENEIDSFYYSYLFHSEMRISSLKVTKLTEMRTTILSPAMMLCTCIMRNF